jgi:hypothetical protein
MGEPLPADHFSQGYEREQRLKYARQQLDRLAEGSHLFQHLQYLAYLQHFTLRRRGAPAAELQRSGRFLQVIGILIDNEGVTLRELTAVLRNELTELDRLRAPEGERRWAANQRLIAEAETRFVAQRLERENAEQRERAAILAGPSGLGNWENPLQGPLNLWRWGFHLWRHRWLFWDHYRRRLLWALAATAATLSLLLNPLLPLRLLGWVADHPRTGLALGLGAAAAYLWRTHRVTLRRRWYAGWGWLERRPAAAGLRATLVGPWAGTLRLLGLGGLVRLGLGQLPRPLRNPLFH